MFKNPDIVWLNTNPYLRRFNLPTIKYLSGHTNIVHWEYQQTEDEGSSLETSLELLHDYLNLWQKPVHLVGHSTCGLLGLYYAHQYPEQVKSLTILGVGANPAIDWLNYYYSWRNNWHCSPEIVLAHLAKYLFGVHSHYYRKALVNILEKAIAFSLSQHSLYKRYSYLEVPKIESPMMIIGSLEDKVVAWSEIQKWSQILKQEDQLWQCPRGEHFFHYFFPQLIAEQIWQFCSLREKRATQLIKIADN